jgi:hypothetical protein
MVIVIVLIGLFASLCQTLTILVALQHRQAFHTTDQAQTHRLADAGLLRALQRLQLDPAWQGETWQPGIPGFEAAKVTIAVQSDGDHIHVTSDAAITSSRDRVLQSRQSITITRPAASSAERQLP